jgi:hypothetical protein
VGEVMLQVDSRVAQVNVCTRALSEWTDPPVSTSKNKYLYTEATTTLQIPPNGPNYDHLTDLTQFPILIDKSVVEKILHIDDPAYALLIKGPSPSLVVIAGSTGKGMVTKSSLLKYLQISQ